MTLAQDIASSFNVGGKISDVCVLEQGLINDTFVVTTEAGHRAILQRINRHVFPRPEEIMENLRTLLGHVRNRQAHGRLAVREFRLPEIYLTNKGWDFLTDSEGGFWRALGFIENTHTLESISHVTQAEEVGFALGRFHALIHDLDPARLHNTLPGFHDTPHYLARFIQVSAHKKPDNPEMRHCFEFIEARRNLVDVLETAKIEGKLVTRPIHGDTKLNNFMFDVESGRAVSLIDLDTVQPGLIHYDIGDCLRSCANLAGESPRDVESVRFDLGICRAILKNYLAETRSFLTQNDYHYLYDAIRLIPFELGLRFLIDHLEGDCYFKIDRPGHNLHRAMAQFRLTASIEMAEKDIKTLIANIKNTQ